jgi:hypothetical protein
LCDTLPLEEELVVSKVHSSCELERISHTLTISSKEWRTFLWIAATVALLVSTASFPAQAQGIQATSVLYNESLKGSGRLPTSDTTYCHLAYESQGYVVGNVSDKGVCDAPVNSPGDLQPHVRIEATAALQKGTADTNFGIYFGFLGGDAQAHFHFSLTFDGKFSVTYLNSGKRVYPFPLRADPSIKKGLNTTNRLAIEIMGAHVHFFINGKEVGSILARDQIRGAMGLGVDSIGSEAVFSDVLVTDLAPGAQATGGQATGRVLIWDDDFVKARNWPLQTGKPCVSSYESDGYVMENTADNSYCILPLRKIGALSSHVIIELTVALQQGANNSDYGLSFGGADSGNNYFFYLFGIDANGSYDLSQHTTEWKDIKPWTADSFVNKGYNSPNKLALEIHGTSVTYSVNGHILGTSTLADDPHGLVGLYLNANGMHAKYTRLTIYDLGQ